ncbi:glycosyl hydrolase family 79 C-terminal domain-containing protein [Umezawaea sp. Da 62-37]|uniref:glycosyl hydrolase family 79 C-terminal domain-containing protein n=1 Tax=Umezawaea sp. Da 62-37 TaxID=3075927 RepID=UPI0028F7032B|nr:glycosyl hydrolase family 79 C-terminal domain-containing protein [Umezawaea sp. Da 62-37]WNV84529.1 glycosyl hydrolase family 79 C-terminal domain-containing protein [Umezawaea sp. Da 62-37]
MSRISTGWRAAVGAAVIVASVNGVAVAAPVSTATITIDSAHPAGRIASDFVGLSFEMRELGIGNLDAAKGNTAALFKTLGRSNVRISGNTLDRDTLWVPEGQQPPDPLPTWVNDVVTPTDVKRLNRFLSVTGWNTMVGINLGRWDAALGADQARSMASILGNKLVAAECGNEPDQWVGKAFRPAGYAYPDYKADWEMCAAAVGSKRIAGPDTAGTSSSWAASLAADEKDRMSMLTVHQYSAGPDATIATLMAPATVTAQLKSVSANLAAAKANGLPFRVDEANSAYGGGVDGVSNKFASALWGLDYSLQMAQAGVDGVNVHGGLGVCNEPIWNGKFQRYTPICAADAADEQAQVYKAMPIYYGLWMARRMGAGRFLPLTLSTDRNVTAYAVKGDDGRTRIAVVQKDDTTAAPVHLDIAVDGRARSADVLRLTGDSLGAEPTAVQGATVDRQGHLDPGKAEQVRVRGGSLGVDVHAGSAVLITLDGC